MLHRHNFVRAVAVPALRRARRAHLVAHAVDATSVFLALFFVAACAVGRRDVFVVLHFLDAVVTINAIQRAVNGFRKTVCGKQRQWLGVTVDYAFVRGIGVAIQAIGTGEFLDRIGRRKTGHGGQTEEHQPDKCEGRKTAVPATTVHTP